VKFNLLSVGLIGGSSVGLIVFLMGAPWWLPIVCASAGLLIGWLLRAGFSDENPRLMAAVRLLRSLPLWDRIAMSIVLVIAATAVFIALRDLPIYGTFCLFLVPIVLAQVLFGTKSGLAAALASQVAIHYFAIPPKNSFSVLSMREVGLVCAFALVALVTWGTITLLSDIARGKTRRLLRRNRTS
jgi:K+-sensing histidine kinase KdpD